MNENDFRINYLLDKCDSETFKLSLVDGDFVFIGDNGTKFPINNNIPKRIISVVDGVETSVTKHRFVVRKLHEKQLKLPLEMSALSNE